MSDAHRLVLNLIQDDLAVCQLAPGSRAPEWAAWEGLWMVLSSPGELTVVSSSERVPPGVRTVRGWRALQVQGPLDFSLVGVLAALTSALAEAGVSVFAVSSYDTDYLLVQGEHLEAAAGALRAAGHLVEGFDDGRAAGEEGAGRV